jgi:hypothetical protein
LINAIIPKPARIIIAVKIHEIRLAHTLVNVETPKFSQKISVGSGALSNIQKSELSQQQPAQHPKNALNLLTKKLPCLFITFIASMGVFITTKHIPVKESASFSWSSPPSVAFFSYLSILSLISLRR